MITRDVNGINKYTVSKANNGIRYETGMLPSENRVAIETAEKLSKRNQFFKSGYNGTPVVEVMYDFEKKFPQLKFEDTANLYDQLITDARTLPIVTQIGDKVGDDYHTRFMVNLNNIYQNAPRFFSDNFIKSPIGFAKYQQYYYLLCFINYIEEHKHEEELYRMNNFDKVLDWISTRRDPNIAYILKGPEDNTPFNINYEEHYNTLISSSSSMDKISQYQQLTTSQTMSSDIMRILNFMMTNPNVFYKTPDEAKKYTITIDSSKGVLVEVDNNNNLIFDCGYVNLGDTTEQNMTAKYDNLDNVQTSEEVDSKLATKKLERIFNMYSRVKILDFVIAPDTFITSLDAFPKVFLVFQGVTCSERNIYNTVENNDFKIGGSFIRTSRGYEFKQDVNAITYKNTRTKVTAFRLFLSLNPGEQNVIIPNEYALQFTKDKLYQHPVLTGQPYSEDIKNVRIPETYTETSHTIEHASVNPNNSLTGALINNSDVDVPVSKVHEMFNKYNGYQPFSIGEGGMSKETLLMKLENVMTDANDVKEFVDSIINSNYLSSVILGQLSTILKKLIDDTADYYEHIQNDTVYDGEINNRLSDFDPNICKEIILATVGVRHPLWNYMTMRESDTGVIAGLSDAFDSCFGANYPLNSYKTIVNEIIDGMENMTVSMYRSLFYELLDNIYIGETSLLSDLSKRQSLWNTTYNVLSKFIKVNVNQSTPREVISYVTTNKKVVDTSNATIDGKYFRIDNLYPKFTDDNGNAYVTPDEDYLIYTDDENDLCLFNLYSYVSGEIKNILYGSFIYSESMNTIQNMEYIIENYEKVKNKLRFDNTYVAVGADGKMRLIVPEWKESNELQTKWSDLNAETQNKESITYYKIVSIRNEDTEPSSVSYLSVNEETKVVTKYLSESASGNEGSGGNSGESGNVDVPTEGDEPQNTTGDETNETSTGDSTNESQNTAGETNESQNTNESTSGSSTSANDDPTIVIDNEKYEEVAAKFNDITEPAVVDYQFDNDVEAGQGILIGKLLTYKVTENPIDNATMYYEYYDKNNYSVYDSDEWTLKINTNNHEIPTPNVESLDGLTLTVNVGTSVPKSFYVETPTSFIVGSTSGSTSGSTESPTSGTSNESTSTGNESTSGSTSTGTGSTSGPTSPTAGTGIDSPTQSESLPTFNGLLLFNTSSTSPSGTMYGTITKDDIMQFVSASFTYVFSSSDSTVTIKNITPIGDESSTRELISPLSYGPIANIVITDYFGNTITLSTSINITSIDIVNSAVNSIDEMHGVEIEGYDLQNNKIVVMYDKVVMNGDDVLLLRFAETIVAEESTTEYSTLLINLSKMSISLINGEFGEIEDDILTATPTNNLVILVDSMTVTDSSTDSSTYLIVNRDALSQIQSYSSEPNLPLSNSFKAFKIHNMDVKSVYWNRSMYINSILHCHLPISRNTYLLPTKTITYNSNDHGVTLYDVDKFGVIKPITGEYKITKNDIMKKVGSATISSGLNRLYASVSSVQSCFMDTEVNSQNMVKVLHENGSSKGDFEVAYILYDEKYIERYTVKLSIIDEKIANVAVYDVNGFYDAKGNYYSTSPPIPLGNYSMGIYSQKPIYINDLEVIISFSYSESLLLKTLNINGITITKAINQTILYTKVKNDNERVAKIYQQMIPTMKFTNVPGRNATSDDFFSLSVSQYDVYKHHPTIKYFENTFVTPKQIDKYGRFLTLANKYNQNLVTSNVYLRNEYRFTNNQLTHPYSAYSDDNGNTLAIGNKINPDIDHIAESLDKNLILIGNMNKTGSMADLAVRSEKVYLVPQSSKLMLTMEFS